LEIFFLVTGKNPTYHDQTVFLEEDDEEDYQIWKSKDLPEMKRKGKTFATLCKYANVSPSLGNEKKTLKIMFILLIYCNLTQNPFQYYLLFQIHYRAVRSLSKKE
jgi:hypothetical protein